MTTDKAQSLAAAIVHATRDMIDVMATEPNPSPNVREHLFINMQQAISDALIAAANHGTGN